MSPLLPDRHVKHLIAMFYLIFWQRQDYNKHNNNKVWLLEKKSKPGNADGLHEQCAYVLTIK